MQVSVELCTKKTKHDISMAPTHVKLPIVSQKRKSCSFLCKIKILKKNKYSLYSDVKTTEIQFTNTYSNRGSIMNTTTTEHYTLLF